jgi:selenide,water dikinase
MATGIGGCLGKVDADRLINVLQTAGLGVGSRSDFVDAEVLQIPKGTSHLASSTDLIFDFGVAPFELGRIAVVHAFSDIFASLAEPLLATVCMGLSRANIENGNASKVLAGALYGLDECGAVAAGGHTVYSADTFVSVSAVGVDPAASELHLDPQTEYDLLLSKPLGSGIYISARRQELLDERAMEEAVRSMRTTNREAAASLAALVPDHTVGCVTDVTGFGLLTALRTQVGDGWDARVQVDNVPFLSMTKALISGDAVMSNLGEKNMFWAQGDPSCDLGDVGVADLIALSDPQTSGGLLAAVRRDIADALVASGDVQWVNIGSLQHATKRAVPTISLV